MIFPSPQDEPTAREHKTIFVKGNSRILLTSTCTGDRFESFDGLFKLGVNPTSLIYTLPSAIYIHQDKSSGRCSVKEEAKTGSP